MATKNPNESTTSKDTTTDTVIIPTATPGVNIVKSPSKPSATANTATQPASGSEQKQPVVQNTHPPVPQTTFKESLAKLKANGTSAQLTLISSIETYMDNMTPGKVIDSKQGAFYQYSLWKAIYNAVCLSDRSEFKSLWNIILGYFNEYSNGIFGERYVYRFTEQWSYSNTELQAFLRTLNLIKLTENPATRANGLKQVDMNRTLADGYTEEGRQRIIGFYSK